MLDEIFTTLGETLLITGAKLVPAFTSRLSGASEIVTLGGGFVFAKTTPDCTNKTIGKQPVMAAKNLFIIPVKLTQLNHSSPQFHIKAAQCQSPTIPQSYSQSPICIFSICNLLTTSGLLVWAV